MGSMLPYIAAPWILWEWENGMNYHEMIAEWDDLEEPNREVIFPYLCQFRRGYNQNTGLKCVNGYKSI